MTAFLPTINQALQLHQAGRLDEAAKLYQHILSHEPRNAGIIHLVGLIAHQQGRHAEAVDTIRKACKIDPKPAEFHVNIASALSALGRHQEAAEAAQRALDRNPNLPPAYNNLAAALTGLGRFDEALAAANRALTLRPDYPEAMLALAAVHAAKGDANAAVATLSTAVDRFPKHPGPMVNLAELILRSGHSAQAAEFCRRALTLRPNLPEALANLANALYELADAPAALEAHRRAVQLQPTDPRTRSNLLLGLHYQTTLTPQEIFQEHQAYAQHCIPPQPVHPPTRQFVNSSTRQLRIAYLSPDFRRHSVAHFLQPILTHHDHSRFHITGYSNNRNDDDLTPTLAKLCDSFRPITFLTDDQAADLIRADHIDILIDLAGHTQSNRLPLFARKPAPLQLTYLGYPNTTGLTSIDYRLTDPISDPPSTLPQPPPNPPLPTPTHTPTPTPNLPLPPESSPTPIHPHPLYTEKLAYLPAPFLCFQPPADAPSPNPLPADSTSYITFACFNHSSKLNPPLLTLWAKLLQAVPNSRLLLKNRPLAQPEFQSTLTQFFAQHNIPAHRLQLLGHITSPANHLAAYHQADLALDTHPYHGTTTTCEALFMGLPVITLIGPAHVSRVGASLLSSINLNDCITTTPDSYITRAATLAADLPTLRTLRQNLRPQLFASPLCDAPTFTQNLESLYQQLWSTHP